MGDLVAVLGTVRAPRVAVIGDVMLDRYTWGKVERISPEAPVPVVAITETTVSAGGAANAAICAAALGASVTVFGATGGDGGGEELAGLLADGGCELRPLVVESAPTITKHRIWSGGQQLLRLDAEEPLPEGMAAAFVERSLEGAAFDAILVSDYDKGVVDDHSFAVVVRAAERAGIPVVVDPKVADFRRYRGSTIIKPNEREALAAYAARFGQATDDIGAIGTYLLGEVAEHAVITRGPRGIEFFSADQRGALPVRSRNVYDVTGAGDVVAAVLAVLAAGGTPLPDACSIANVAAGICVGRVGTGGVATEAILAAIREHGAEDPA